MSGAVAILQPETGNLAIYERMCTAIAECARVDEAKDIRDKALALEAYYRQARNLDAEREAANVRLRAERRVGELLKELARATNEDRAQSGGLAKAALSADVTKQTISQMAMPKGPSPYAAALAEQGMSRQAAHRFQSLADIPERDFEAALRGPDKPTTAGLLKHAEARRAAHSPAPTPVVSDDALWLWGRLRDFENRGYLTSAQDRLLTGMTDAMRADVRRLAPLVADFLTDLELHHEPA